MSVTSWNEFGEGTQIEPVQQWTDPDTGQAYKDYSEGGSLLYLKITQQLASKFIQQWQDQQTAAAAGHAGSSDAAQGLAEGVVDEDLSAGGGASGAAAESDAVGDTARVEL